MLPYASGVAMARVPRITGAFQGAIPTTTPAGSRRAMRGGAGDVGGDHLADGGVGLGSRLAQHAAASWQLNMPQPKVPPVSSVTIAAICSARS